jgi:hypothetical protein
LYLFLIFSVQITEFFSFIKNGDLFLKIHILETKKKKKILYAAMENVAKKSFFLHINIYQKFYFIFKK